MSQLKAKTISRIDALVRIASFESRLIPEPNSGCWLWLGTRVKDYGQFRVGAINYLAHRVSYTIYVGEIGHRMHVLHRCDNPACVNPEHLYAGTHRKNMDDRNSRGRSRNKPHIGESNPQARINAEIVRRVRADTRPGPVAAPDYGITAKHYHKIKRREIWRHVQ